MFGKEAVIRNRGLEIHLPRFNSTIKFSHLQYDSDVNSHLGAQYSVNNSALCSNTHRKLYLNGESLYKITYRAKLRKHKSLTISLRT